MRQRNKIFHLIIPRSTATSINWQYVKHHSNCDDINLLITKVYLSELKTQVVPRRKHSVPRL